MSNPSLGLSLKTDIEKAYGVFRTENLFIENAKAGKTTPLQLCEFLDNIFYLIQHTPVLLRLARRVCLEKGLTSLAEFYDHKIDEELGHEYWAVQDLKSLEQKFGVKPSRAVSPHMKELVDSIRKNIESDPVYYLCYILLAEHFTVLASPDWLNSLEAQCGIPASSASVIGNHVELDKDHVLEMVTVIDKFAPYEQYSEMFKTHLNKYLSCHGQFCQEISQLQ